MTDTPDTPIIDAPLLDTPLHDGEVLLKTWRPSFALFAQRALLLGFATALALSGFGLLLWWQWLLALPVFTLIYVLVFDDYTTWMRHRGDAWHLTNLRLIFENPDAPEGSAAVQLPEIDRTCTWFWWSVRLHLSSGTSLVMRFVRDPGGVGRAIAAARDALKGL